MIRNAGSRLVVLPWLFCVFVANSSAAGPTEDFRTWGNVTTVTNLGGLDRRLARWRWWMEAQGRFRDSSGAADQSIVRTAVGYAVAEHTTAWLGYAYVPTFPEATGTRVEHRLFQQLIWSNSLAGFAFMSRTRLEQRFLETVSAAGCRLREFVRFSRPVAEDSALSFVVWDEVFVHLNSVSPAIQSGFDQNRVFAGLGFQFHETARSEIGYLNQFIHTDLSERMNHILSLSLFLNF